MAGDALLTYAFQLLSSVAMKLAGTELRVLRDQEVSNACGTTGLIGGQVLDLQSENQIVDEDTLRFIHRKKTGALFAASVHTGALLAGANQEQLEDLTKYADYLGLAFQITDDILDIEGEASILGKPTGSDLRNRKATYPHLLGLDRSRSLVQECIEKALQSIASFDRKRTLKGIGQLHRREKQLVGQGKKCLNIINVNQIKRSFSGRSGKSCLLIFIRLPLAFNWFQC